MTMMTVFSLTLLFFLLLMASMGAMLSSLLLFGTIIGISDDGKLESRSRRLFHRTFHDLHAHFFKGQFANLSFILFLTEIELALLITMMMRSLAMTMMMSLKMK